MADRKDPSTDKTTREVKQPTTDRDAPKIERNSEQVRDNLDADVGPTAPMPDGVPQPSHTPGS